MSLSWKLLPFAAFAVLGAFALLPGGAARPDPVSAAFEDCGNSGVNLIIEIIDTDTNDPITVAGAVVEVDPDPIDGSGSPNWTDNSSADNDNEAGVIELEDVCVSSDGSDDYVVNLVSLPAALEDCDIETETVTEEAPQDNDPDLVVTLEVNCEDVATVTPTVGAAATVIAQASPNTVNCNGTSIVTIQVRTASGQPVAVGTQVQITASIGQVSPSSGQTTSGDGSVFAFFTAPSNQGGQAVITAKAGNAQGTATVTVNCAAAQPTATTAPPPPTVAPGSISPPNTGDAGIVSGSDSKDWTPFAGLALVAATLVAGAVAAVRTRE